MAFTHLHVHTEYSLLDGSNKIKEYVAQVKALGMTSAAITDHGVMYGCMDFYKTCLDQGIKPILGCEVYVAPGSRFDKEQGAGEDRYFHLVLLAETNEGYDNLMKIVSAGFVDGFYYRPRVDKEILRAYHEGIICLSACLAGEVPRNITKGDYEGAKKAALEYLEIFGEGNYFLELQDHGIPEQRHVNQMLLRMHEETGIPIVCTNDIHYTYKEDVDSHDILLCIQTGKKVTDENRMRYEGGQYYVKSPEEMQTLFSYAPEACENTEKIAERCNVNIVFGERKIPEYDVPDGKTSWEYLQELCQKGMEAKYETITPEMKERLDYELNTIHSMGFVDYFLIVWDYINYAKQHGIIVGPGRGSAAGSIVSYALGITELDPLRYGLLFERFLNPERVTMPDIDVDFCFERRQEVIDYVVEKYGRDRVVQIVTFGTMAARGVLRDVGRVLDMPYSDVDVIAKMVPQELNITLKRALEMNPDLRKKYEEEEETRYLIDMAMRLEGLPRNTSMHAAGVVISKKPVVEYVPLSRAQDGSITTQYTMTTLEELGLLKMDFLGLRTLTVIQNAEKLVNNKLAVEAGETVTRDTEPKKRFDVNKIDYNDPAVMTMIGKGKTQGVFQLESGGMKNFMKELKPRTLEDIIAGIALYRPGPMDFIPRYIDGKNHPEHVTYDCPEMEPILQNTYGCIVYQEQVMQIVRDLGGYSMGRSDLVRRAMSKKKESVMAKERQNFIYGNEAEHVPGCVAKGIPEATANHIFDEMTSFARYAFNKSHAACYAVVAFQTAYLMYYYPDEYMAALMTSVIDNPGKCAEYLVYCREMKIPTLPPSVNAGYGVFTTENGAIRCGMYAIKSVGRGVIDNIVAEREANGPYEDLKDFLTRTYGKDLNKRAIENLIKAGALDNLGGNRRQCMQIYPQILDQVAAENKETISGQMSLFDFMQPEMKKQFEIKMPPVQEFDPEMKLAFEKDVLGVYMSGHPLDGDAELLKSRITCVTTDFAPDEESGQPKVKDNAFETIGGMVANTRIQYTKNNKVMAFLVLEDLVGQVEVIVFPNSYEKFRQYTQEDSKIFIEGHVSAEDEKASKLICDRIYPFSEVPRALWLAFPSAEAWSEAESTYRSLTADAYGKDEVFVFLRDKKLYKRLTGTIDLSAEREAAIREAFGDENVTIRFSKAKRPSGQVRGAGNGYGGRRR